MVSTPLRLVVSLALSAIPIIAAEPGPRLGELRRAFEPGVGEGAPFVHRGSHLLLTLSDGGVAEVVPLPGDPLAAPVRLEWIGADAGAVASGAEPLTGRLRRGGIDAPLFTAIRIAELYPGVVLDVRADGLGVAFAPAGSDDRLRLGVRGAEVLPAGEGRFLLRASAGDLVLRGALRLEEDGTLAVGGDGFVLQGVPGAATSDPVRLAVDPSGAVLLATTARGDETLLAKLHADGLKLEWASYLDAGRPVGLALGRDGRLLVASDASVVALESDGSAVAWRSAIGGSIRAIAADPLGGAWIAGAREGRAWVRRLGTDGTVRVERDLGAGAVGALAIDGNDVLVSGSLDGAAFVARLSADRGEIRSLARGKGAAGTALSADARGGAWVAGDGFVARVAPDGAWSDMDTPALVPSAVAAGSDRAWLAGSADGAIVVSRRGAESDDRRLGIGEIGGMVLGPHRALLLAGTTPEPLLAPGPVVATTASGADVFLASVPVEDVGPRAAGCPGTVNFDNSAGTGLWQTASNWDTNVLPGPADDVCIGPGFAVTLSSGSQSILSLTTDATASLTLGAATLTIASASAIGGPLTINSTSANLAGAGNVTVSGLFSWSAGTLSGGSLLHANGGASLTGASSKDLNPRTLRTSGTVNWSGTGAIRLGTSSLVDIPGGTWDLASDTGFGLLTGGGTVSNGGTFRKSAGAGTSSVGVDFDNAGTVDVQAGTLSFNGGGTSSGSFIGSLGTTLRFGGGTHALGASSSASVPTVACANGTVNVDGAYAATSATTVSNGTLAFGASATITALGAVTVSGGTLNLSTGDPQTLSSLSQSAGSLGGSDTLTVSGTTTWSGGFMSGGGTTQASGGLSLTGAGVRDLNSRTLRTPLGATWSGTGQVRLGTGSVIDNAGLWDVQGDLTIGTLTGGGTFSNASAGTLRKSAGVGTLTMTAALNNAGTVEVQTGTLTLNGGGTHAGAFTGAVGTTLRFEGGVHALGTTSSVNVSNFVVANGTVNVDGAYAATNATTVSNGTLAFGASATITALGAVTVSGGTLNLSTGDPQTLSSLSQSAGSLGGSDTLTVSGTTTWSGGFMSGGGTTQASGGLSLTGAGVRDLNSRTLRTPLGATWSGTGQVRLGTGSVIDNAGLWDVQGDLTIGTLTGGGTFSNASAGTLRKSAGVGTLTMTAALNNAGTVEVQTGTLTLNGGGTHAGAFTGAVGTTLRFEGGVHALGTTSSVNVSNFVVANGTVNVDGAYAASATTVSNGTLAFGATATITALGAVTVSGGTLNLSTGDPQTLSSLSQSAGSLGGSDTLTVSGTTTWSGGFMSGGGTTQASGGLSLTGAGVRDLNSRTLRTPLGATWSGTGQVRLGTGSVIDNAGLWDVQGDLTIGTLTGGGTFSNASAGTLRKSAGVGTLTMTPALNNAGTVEVQTGTLALSGGGTHAGAFTGAVGTTLRFDSGVHALGTTSSVNVSNVVVANGTVNVNGAYASPTGTTIPGGALNFGGPAVVTALGALTVSGGTLAVATGDPLSASSMTMSAGTLDGPDTLAVSGTTTWTAGLMQGAGVTQANGGLLLSGTSSHDVSARTLRMQGASTWTGTGTLRLGLGAVVDNQGTWDVQTDSSIVNLTGGGSVTNGGTLRKSAGAATHSIQLPFTNTGAVESQSGTLSFTAGYTQTAGSSLTNGGTLSSTAPFQIQGGTFGGTGTFVGGVNSTAGTAVPGLSPGIATVSGTYQQGASGGFSVELGGLNPGTQHDRLDVTGIASLGGSLAASFIGGFVPSLGDAFTILTAGTRSGTFATTSLPALGPGQFWYVRYNDQSVQIEVVPRPAGETTGKLVLAKSGANLQLIWGTGCLVTDTDYSVYQGTLGSWASHAPSACSTAGATTWTLSPMAGSAYYLVVPHNGAGEGSYGQTDTGQERPASASACHLQSIESCP